MILAGIETLRRESAADGMFRRLTNIFRRLAHFQVFGARNNAEQTWNLLHSTSVVDQEERLSMRKREGAAEYLYMLSYAGKSSVWNQGLASKFLPTKPIQPECVCFASAHIQREKSSKLYRSCLLTLACNQSLDGTFAPRHPFSSSTEAMFSPYCSFDAIRFLR